MYSHKVKSSTVQCTSLNTPEQFDTEYASRRERESDGVIDTDTTLLNTAKCTLYTFLSDHALFHTSC